MSLTPKQVTRLKRAIKRLVAAEITNSWKGMGTLEALADIARDLSAARKHLDKVLRDISQPEPGDPS
jgi:ubiquinone biosynthesis protein UbiJ